MSFEKRVLAFHYVWYGTPWGPNGAWRGWNVKMEIEESKLESAERIVNGNRIIASAHYPLDGVYDSLSEDTIKRQLLEYEQAGIDGMIISWWGTGDYSDKVLDAFVKKSPENFLTIYYETAITFKLRDKSREEAIERIFNDLYNLLNRYAKKKQWIKVEEKPLLALYIVENYTIEEWELIKNRLKGKGYDVFFLADTYNTAYLKVMDGLHTYNPIGITLRGKTLKEVYFNVASRCKEKGALFAATVCPGYDDRKIRTPGLYVPRAEGSYYQKCWEAAKESKADWALICSYNEWYEGSEIEPSQEYGKDYLYLTSQNSKVLKGKI